MKKKRIAGKLAQPIDMAFVADIDPFAHVASKVTREQLWNVGQDFKVSAGKFRRASQPAGLAKLLEIEKKARNLSPKELERFEDGLRHNAEQLARRCDEDDERLELLFHHYKINRTGNEALDYKRLLLRVVEAESLFPGFLVNEPTAQPYQRKRGDPLTQLLLLADIETVKREWTHPRECLDGDAVRHLRTKEPFKEQWGKIPQKTLVNWLSDARNSKKNRYLPFWRAYETRNDLPWLIERINLRVRGTPHP
jgi:hypothetical protein